MDKKTDFLFAESGSGSLVDGDVALPLVLLKFIEMDQDQAIDTAAEILVDTEIDEGDSALLAQLGILLVEHGDGKAEHLERILELAQLLAKIPAREECGQFLLVKLRDPEGTDMGCKRRIAGKPGLIEIRKIFR